MCATLTIVNAQHRMIATRFMYGTVAIGRSECGEILCRRLTTFCAKSVRWTFMFDILLDWRKRLDLLRLRL